MTEQSLVGRGTDAPPMSVGFESGGVAWYLTPGPEDAAGSGPPTAHARVAADLAPEIHRQRLVVEGLCRQSITAEQISDYLSRLSDTIGMVTLLEPVTHCSPTYGWAGWIHWETSGAHFYAWDVPRLFFSVDVYACKPFDVDTVVAFTRDYFDSPAVQYRSV